MRTVHEVSEHTGVSARALRHYDAIGLLKPTKLTEAGYRLYDEEALGRLRMILLFRELQFPLKEIKAILDCPDFNPEEAIAQQIRLLELEYQHIGELISFAREIQKKGVNTMDFQVFDRKEIDNYQAEVKARWGRTAAYQEYAQRSAQGGGDNGAAYAREMMDLFSGFGALRHLSPGDPAAQEQVAALRDFITQNFYTCDKTILNSLGQMYVDDERFRKNIDQSGGEGTAEFVRQAIEIYCGRDNRD